MTDMAAGIELARQVIAAGKAKQKLRELAALTKQLAAD